MEFSIATILGQFVNDKLVAAKVLEKKLGCQEEESVQRLRIALDALERIGVLAKEMGKYRRLYEEDVVEAKLRCSSKGFCFAIQDKEEAEDIYIRETNLSNAWNGDRVLVKVIKEGSRRRSPEGEVKLILNRANPSLLAQVKKENSHYSAVPLDDRLLFELELQQNGEELEKAVDHLVHVSVLRYPIAQNSPLGQVSRILGSDAEAAADTDIVCCKHDLPHDFTEDLVKAAQSLPQKLPKAEIDKRQDLRSLLTFAIEAETDNPETVWIENAFSLEQTTAGQWQIGIHIADIAHYIQPDSPLDREGYKRGTAVYLGDKVLPLFPDEVAQRCSLLAGEERLALSIFITLNQETGQLVEFEIQPSVIKVDRQLNYQQIQSLLSNSEEVSSELKEVVDRVNQLFFTLSPLIKAQRLQRGGFEIAVPEIQSPYKDEGRLGAIVKDPALPVRSLLTELVILAGKLVAEHLLALGVPGIYCHQQEPDWDELEDLLKLSNNLQLELNLEAKEDITPQDYQNLTQAFAQCSVSKVLNYLLQATLNSVKYASHPGFHFGLAYTDGYTHIISPGQRYTDLLSQRILKTVFEQGRDRRHSLAKKGVNLGSSTCHGEINWKVLPPAIQTELEEQIHLLIPHLNEREKLAEDAEKDLEGLKKAEKMKERTGQIFRGLITGVQSYGFFVEIEDLLVEGLVHVSSLKDDWYEYRSRYSCLVGRKNRVAYHLGDEVEVEVKSVDYYRQQIDLAAVKGGTSASRADLEEE